LTKLLGDPVARKIKKQIFHYTCTMTEEEFKTTRKAPSPDDLISIDAYYDMHPEKDDRPEHVKKDKEVEIEVDTTDQE
jgi:hypothetical protein